MALIILHHMFNINPFSSAMLSVTAQNSIFICRILIKIFTISKTATINSSATCTSCNYTVNKWISSRIVKM